MDFYQAQNKYRQKQLRFIFTNLLKILFIFIIFFSGWRFGNSDKEILIQENEKIVNKFIESKNILERNLAEIRLKLKEANLALDTKNIRNGQSRFGRNAKNVLASTLANGVPENIIVDNLRLLGKKKVCNNVQYKELPVSTKLFIPPQNTLRLLSGSLKIKAEGNILDISNDNPYFDSKKPMRISFIYFGNNDLVEGNLPIKKTIFAGKFSVKIELVKSKVRGAVLVNYITCKV